MVDPGITTQDPLGLLTLLGLPGIGRQTAERLAVRFRRLGDVTSASEEDLRSVVPARALPAMAATATWDKAHDEAKTQIDRAYELGVRIIPKFDPAFPRLLACIPDPPLLLYIKGSMRTERLIAGVGTRTPSVFGTTVATRLTKFLCEKGWGIVSGLATGIDTVCHQTALDAAGYTIAVLANGLESVYPASNKRLADQIVASGGALVSEQPFGARAFAQNLIQRDRLQSGLSVATFVMQTDIRGGTMHTVRFTLFQRRRLFVPIPTGSHRAEPKSQGIVVLAEQNGPQLCTTLAADGEYADILRSEFADRPPAQGIRGTEDYEHVLAILDTPLESSPAKKLRGDQGGLFN